MDISSQVFWVETHMVAGSYSKSMFSFIGNCQAVFQCACAILYSHQQWMWILDGPNPQQCGIVPGTEFVHSNRCVDTLCVSGCVTSSSDFLGRLITRDQAGKDTARLKYFRVLPEPSGGSFGHIKWADSLPLDIIPILTAFQKEKQKTKLKMVARTAL